MHDDGHVAGLCKQLLEPVNGSGIKLANVNRQAVVAHIVMFQELGLCLDSSDISAQVNNKASGCVQRFYRGWVKFTGKRYLI